MRFSAAITVFDSPPGHTGPGPRPSRSGGHGGVHRRGGGLPGRVDGLRHVAEDGFVGSVLAED